MDTTNNATTINSINKIQSKRSIATNQQLRHQLSTAHSSQQQSASA